MYLPILRQLREDNERDDGWDKLSEKTTREREGETMVSQQNWEREREGERGDESLWELKTQEIHQIQDIMVFKIFAQINLNFFIFQIT